MIKVSSARMNMPKAIRSLKSKFICTTSHLCMMEGQPPCNTIVPVKRISYSRVIRKMFLCSAPSCVINFIPKAIIWPSCTRITMSVLLHRIFSIITTVINNARMRLIINIKITRNRYLSYLPGVVRTVYLSALLYLS